MSQRLQLPRTGRTSCREVLARWPEKVSRRVVTNKKKNITEI